MKTHHPREHKPSKPLQKGLHPRNRHQQGYDFSALTTHYPALAPYVTTNAHGNLSIDFADPLAVKTLNAALLHHCYHIVDWDIPDGALCPPIPGRADYIHHIADLIGHEKSDVRLLDIGTGASGIYPLLACQIYGWHCVGTDINPQSLHNVTHLINANPTLQGRITLRRQDDKNHVFDGIIQPDDFFDVSVCNPPFHASLEDALKGSQRKLNNLARNRGESQAAQPTPTLNFGGQGAELWCKGGESLFLKKMIKESQHHATQCRWFSSLVSNSDHVKPAIKLIHKQGARDVREIDMKQGNKITRVLAWTYC
ncbi:MAG: 23S rRNA (adenine(1618)-N(6))-methyltransferase RlmF [Bacterioplanes sp.]|nr:23S rRNA (adenine(1618)-N(6))-methyltransferase RlmF [Bacterioplanes sp.]